MLVPGLKYPLDFQKLVLAMKQNYCFQNTTATSTINNESSTHIIADAINRDALVNTTTSCPFMERGVSAANDMDTTNGEDDVITLFSENNDVTQRSGLLRSVQSSTPSPSDSRDYHLIS